MAVHDYVRPPTFDAAAAWLRRNHLVVLTGPPGSGRRAGGAALLREVTAGPIVAPPATVTAEDLAGWEYQPRYGYLLVDHEDTGEELLLALIADRLRYAGAYLVITTSAGPASPTGMPYLPWQRPPVVEGLRHPAAAAGRLWQLIIQDEDRRAANCAALGRLFAVLVDQTGQADAVLDLLDSSPAWHAEGQGARQPRQAAAEALLAVLTAPSRRTRRPAVAEWLLAQPGRAEVAARLWQRVITSRNSNREAVAALWSALSALRQRADGGVSADLGRAFAAVLTGAERSRLRADLLSCSRLRSGPLPQGLGEFLLGVAAPAAPVPEAEPPMPTALLSASSPLPSSVIRVSI